MNADRQKSIQNAVSQIRFADTELIPAVAQDIDTKDVLMIGFMNQKAFEQTLVTGYTHYWSRSRSKLWQKGESSGHTQHVESISINCERNAILLSVRQIGAVCHDGYPSCFYREFQEDGSLQITLDRWFDPTLVYGIDQNVVPLWWGAYEYLRDHVEAGLSGTARLLQDPDANSRQRLADELKELSGVLNGEHVHSGLTQDAVLEGSQVLYWLVVDAIRNRQRQEDLHIESALSTTSDNIPVSTMASLLAAESERSRQAIEPMSPEEANAVITIVAQAATSAGVPPVELLKSDIQSLRSRPYLKEYFEQHP